MDLGDYVKLIDSIQEADGSPYHVNVPRGAISIEDRAYELVTRYGITNPTKLLKYLSGEFKDMSVENIKTLLNGRLIEPYLDRTILQRVMGILSRLPLSAKIATVISALTTAAVGVEYVGSKISDMFSGDGEDDASDTPKLSDDQLAVLKKAITQLENGPDKNHPEVQKTLNLYYKKYGKN